MTCDKTVLYDWGVLADGGVTDSEDAAIFHVAQALRYAPSGTRGTIRPVVLASDGEIAYVQRQPGVNAWRDDTSGAVMLLRVPSPEEEAPHGGSQTAIPGRTPAASPAAPPRPPEP